MTGPRFGRPRQRSPALLAGWLFADLLLVLFLVNLATEPSGSTSHPKPPPTASPSPSPSSSPSPSPSQAFIGKKFCELLLPLNTRGIEENDKAAESQLVRSLGVVLAGHDNGKILNDAVNEDGDKSSCIIQLAKHLRAGVVIAYGASPDIGTGLTLGENAVADIIRLSPRFSGASSFSGWTGEHGSNAVELIVFFIGGP